MKNAQRERCKAGGNAQGAKEIQKNTDQESERVNTREREEINRERGGK